MQSQTKRTGLQNAEIAQLVEHNLAKVRVASSSLVFRSKNKKSAEMLTFVLKIITRRGSIICQSSLCTRDGFFVSTPAVLPLNRLIKTVSWFEWRAARGIVSGRDPTRSVGRDEVGTCSDEANSNQLYCFLCLKAMSRTPSGNEGHSRNNCGGRAPAT